MKNKNILYISFDGILDPLGQSQIIPYVNQISRFGNLTLISLEKHLKIKSLKKENKKIEELIKKAKFIPEEIENDLKK